MEESRNDRVPAEGKWRCSACGSEGPVFGRGKGTLQTHYPTVERPWNCAKRLVRDTRCPSCDNAPPCLTVLINPTLVGEKADYERWMEENGRWG